MTTNAHTLLTTNANTLLRRMTNVLLKTNRALKVFRKASLARDDRRGRDKSSARRDPSGRSSIYQTTSRRWSQMNADQKISIRVNPRLSAAESILILIRASARRAGTSPAPTIFGAFVILLGAALILAPAQAQTRKPRAVAKKNVTSAKKTTSGASAKKTTGVSLGTSPAKTLVIASVPNAVVWVDGVRRGVTDESGRIELKGVVRAPHVIRVRAKGFAENTVAVVASEVWLGHISVPLNRTMTDAERAFQDAEEAREKATEESRKSAVELYRRAISLRRSYPAARVGLARTLSELGDFDAALAEIEAARKGGRGYAEASVVEGRIYHSSGDDAAALESYRRAIQEARGFQPEAHTGIGIILQEKGDYAGAATEFRKAVAQLSDTEPVVYQLLGEAYEKQEKYKDAVAAYEKYLELAPEGKLAPAIQSIIEQLRKQAAEQDQPPPI
jgi:tetratricopeptide (TPR) repeat protein